MTNGQKKPTDNLRFAVLAVDVVLFTIKDGKLLVRLIGVDRPPAFPKGSKGFPGGLIKPTETAEEAAERIIKDKAGISARKIYSEQLYTFSTVNRDPRGRVVSVSYIALVPWDKLSAAEQKNSNDSWWTEIDRAKGLAYDHDAMLKYAKNRLQTRFGNSTIASKILPKEFTLGMLERVYETILGERQDKRNFRKKIAKLKILKELPRKQTGEPFRPAQLYSFKTEKIDDIDII